MTFWENILESSNISLLICSSSLIFFDLEKEKNYIKIAFFLSGSIFIVNLYRFTSLGDTIDTVLDTKLFKTGLKSLI